MKPLDVVKTWHLSGRNLVESLVENLIKLKGTLPSKGEKNKYVHSESSL